MFKSCSVHVQNESCSQKLYQLSMSLTNYLVNLPFFMLLFIVYSLSKLEPTEERMFRDDDICRIYNLRLGPLYNRWIGSMTLPNQSKKHIVISTVTGISLHSYHNIKMTFPCALKSKCLFSLFFINERSLNSEPCIK